MFRFSGHYLILFCLTLMMPACTTGPVDPEHTPFYKIQAGSTLRLNNALTIPANTASVYVQNGTVKESHDLNRYYPYCKFEVNTLLDKSQTVNPDTFLIYRSVWEESIADLSTSPYRQVVFYSSPSFSVMYRVLYLRSERQPDVLRLSCGHWALPPDFDHITINEMRETMGDMMTLTLAGKTD